MKNNRLQFIKNKDIGYLEEEHKLFAKTENNRGVCPNCGSNKTILIFPENGSYLNIGVNGTPNPVIKDAMFLVNALAASNIKFSIVVCKNCKCVYCREEKEINENT